CTDCADLNGVYILDLAVGRSNPCIWQYSFVEKVCGYFSIAAYIAATNTLILDMAASMPDGSGWVLEWRKAITVPAQCSQIAIGPGDWDYFSDNDKQWCGWPEVEYPRMCDWSGVQVSLRAV
ncbi:MAG: hypothetical protein ABSG68_27110, partial [Thermoguttaceae bacterium]